MSRSGTVGWKKSAAQTAGGRVREAQTPGFDDVPAGAFYSEAVRWASENGVLAAAEGNTFSPGLSCSRAEALTALWRAAGTPEPERTGHPFSDVPETAPCLRALLWASERGIALGTGAGRFSPEAVCTRQQLVTFLWRASGCPEASGRGCPFVDLFADLYSWEAVRWALERGITRGISGRIFGPELDCTRGQLAEFLFRWAGRA